MLTKTLLCDCDLDAMDLLLNKTLIHIKKIEPNSKVMVKDIAKHIGLARAKLMGQLPHVNSEMMRVSPIYCLRAYLMLQPDYCFEACNNVVKGYTKLYPKFDIADMLESKGYLEVIEELMSFVATFPNVTKTGELYYWDEGHDYH